ncbi:hypothetical protein BDQ94DRAFT_165028 [Aspergillus welwitschiae]|uniref:Uncharacterized protein n=1 Tax=Aspergillus welwitschiae TaxID=1341132 RepID=A0A3F3QJJ2_9EURO|nr:hypothetical protein BDQ94DRAFT_165028 [Aspergillus welwitschiae]RDH39295.1 hypothetical protein BDQ94DRAFT_165028 [Aspergillus welwitschiae]
MAPTPASVTLEPQGTPTMTNPDQHAWKPLTWSLIVFFLLVALFYFALDNTIMANVQPAIIGILGYYMPWYLDGGIALALTIAYTIFLNKYTGRIAAILPQQPGDTIQQAIFGVRAEFFNSLSVDDVFVFMIAAAALSVALALVMKWERLFVGFGSPHGDDAEVKEVKEVKEGEIGFLGQPQRSANDISWAAFLDPSRW